MAMDPMDEFEFKPITEGLGFHKKAEKIKADLRSGSGSIVQNRVASSIPEAPPGASSSFFAGSRTGSGKSSSGFSDLSVPDRAPSTIGEQISNTASSLNDLASSLGLTDSGLDSSFASNSRSATQSISDLIASLPPSLDFVEDGSAGKFSTDKSRNKSDSRASNSLGSSASASMAASMGSSGHSASSNGGMANGAGNGLANGFGSGLGATSIDSKPNRPQIFQPLGRDDYGSPNRVTAGSTSPMNSTTGATHLTSNSGFGAKSATSQNAIPSSVGSSVGGLNSKTPNPAKGIHSPTGSMNSRSAAGPTLGSVLSPTPGSNAGATIGSTLGGGTGSSYLPKPGSKAFNTTNVAPTPASAYRGQLDQSYARAFPHAEKKSETEVSTPRETQIEGLEAIPTNMIGAILDGMVSLGLATVFLVSILAITHVNLMGLIRNADTQGPTLINLGGLFLIVNLIYMLVTRVSGGSTLGEWAFDLQMGSNDDRQTIAYFFKVMWRQVVMVATAFLPFPLLSLMMRRDMMRPLSGLQLYRRVD